MPDYFRAIAVDFDGTLTSAGRPDEAVLDAVAETRRSGRRVVLVTGRILAELREVFPDVEQWFDALVTENGAVISGTWGRRPVADAVDPRVQHELERRGHEVRSGRVLLACRAEADVDALALIHRLGLGYQLVYNRSELMILPAGVTKATGLAQALVDLGLSPHSAIGIGDAENDHSLLESCELGVAVANAVDALKRHADLVLDETDGLGVAGFLRGPVVGGEQRIHPRRWHVHLGTTSNGEPVTIPASQVNVLITGASRSGKSYLTGLFAEQLIDLGYSVVLVDPEGDHTNLDLLPGVAVVGGNQDPPDADHLAHLVTQGRGSVVIDLSQMGTDAKRTYYCAATPRLSELRAHSGLPHWVIFDEAHEPLSAQAAARSLYEPSRKGHCLITHRPAELGRDSINDLDVLIAMLPEPARRDAEESRMYLASLSAFTGLTAEELTMRTAGLEGATAVLVRPSAPHLLVPFTLGTRRTSHVRHWHSYTDGALDWHRRFFFHRAEHKPTGAVAANMVQFHHELTHCAPEVVCHHARNADFSRWIDGVLRDHILASRFRRIECAHPDQADAEAARTQLLTALEERYLG